jgi:methionyl-tRNA formyltransferase
MKKALRIAYFGTPQFAVVVLDELKAAGFLPTVVVTAPDKPRGRHLKLTPSEAKVWAIENGIEVLQPKKIDEEFLVDLKNSPWDLFVVAAYGKILPKALLDIPAHGTLNVHPSLLPRLRGPSPIQSAILLDEKVTGVSIMLLDEELDHGPILSQASVEIEDWPPKATILEALLAHEGGQLLAETIPLWVEGKITPEAQDHGKATYTRKLTRDDGLLSLSGDPEEDLRKIRALTPWPGAYFTTVRHSKDLHVKVTEAEIVDGKLLFKRVVPEGKREMDYEDFLRG